MCLGYDGDWVNHQQLYISPGHFRVTDLEQVLPDGPRADLVLCLEVAEHLSAAAADTLVDNLVHLGDKIIFSAAVPNQGGQFHVNEQAADYWIAKFRARGFVFYDVFRERFWNNPKVNWWYKQNMFLVMHASLSPDNYLFPAYEAGIRQYIHPDLLAVHAQQASELKQQLRRIKSGRLSLRFYLQLLKTKSQPNSTGLKTVAIATIYPIKPAGVSVIVCCYNSAGRLPETLKHLALQQVPQALNGK